MPVDDEDAEERLAAADDSLAVADLSGAATPAGAVGAGALASALSLSSTGACTQPVTTKAAHAAANRYRQTDEKDGDKVAPSAFNSAALIGHRTAQAKVAQLQPQAVADRQCGGALIHGVEVQAHRPPTA